MGITRQVALGPVRLSLGVSPRDEDVPEAAIALGGVWQDASRR